MRVYGVRNYSSVIPVPARRILRGLSCDHTNVVTMGGIACDSKDIPIDNTPRSFTFCRYCGKLLHSQPLDEVLTQVAEHGY